MSERKRREAAYRQSVEAILAYIDGEDADLHNLLDAAATADPMATAYRLTKLAAAAVEQLASVWGQDPSATLESLLGADAVQSTDCHMVLSRDDLGLINNALNEILHGPEAIEDWEFSTRVGASRAEAADLLRRVGDAYTQSERGH